MTKELIAKLEALEAPDAGLFRMVASECIDMFPSRFDSMIRCEAWESAAILLVPVGWAYLLCHTKLENVAAISNASGDREYSVSANHPAIALLICILKAKEAVE